MPIQSRNRDKANEFSLIPERKLLELYSWTVRCRLLGDLLEGAHPCANSRDLEAAAVAVCLDLRRGDRIFATGGEFLPAYVRDRKLEAALEALRAPGPSVSARLKEALAAARELKRSRTRSIVAVFCAGAAGRGAAWKQALSIADAETLPLIFVRILSARDAGSGHAEHGFAAIPADCHDVVAIYRVAAESFAHARRGDGATLIECAWWPLAEDGGNDAVVNLEDFLDARGIGVARTKAAASASFGRDVRRFVKPRPGRKTARQMAG